MHEFRALQIYWSNSNNNNNNNKKKQQQQQKNDKEFPNFILLWC